MNKDQKTVRIYTGPTMIANGLIARLNEEGISPIVKDDHHSGITGGFSTGVPNQVRLFIRNEHIQNNNVHIRNRKYKRTQRLHSHRNDDETHDDDHHNHTQPYTYIYTARDRAHTHGRTRTWNRDHNNNHNHVRDQRRYHAPNHQHNQINSEKLNHIYTN